jgi:hypothetical protein
MCTGISESMSGARLEQNRWRFGRLIAIVCPHVEPHRSETLKLSTDPQFLEKVRDIVGLYLDPPDRALVLCADEETQIQALDRSQPVLPMRLGQARRRRHDYSRHGTTSLFAVLDARTGRVGGFASPSSLPGVSQISGLDRRFGRALDSGQLWHA